MADSSISIRMLRLPDVMAITGLSRAAIYAKCNPKDKARYDPDFPQRVQLSANTVAWPSDCLQAWLDKRIAASRATHDTSAAGNGGKPQKLADPFEIVGRGQDFEGNEYRVIEFKRNGRTERRALPMDIVGRPDGWGFLRGLGIGVKQGSMLMGLPVLHGVSCWRRPPWNWQRSGA